ncbi:MAG: sugar ABC transporter permease [Clostridiales bacterium]|nr:sugar ABC transporter permease [Clostridiales bacterium]
MQTSTRCAADSSGKCRQVLHNIAKNRTNYLFLLPFGLVFLIFTVIPVVMAIVIGFTSFNVLEPAEFIGWENYRRLFFNDDLFITALTNTLTFAVILGPAGYLLSLTFAWFINELGPKLRAFMTLLFYAPSLANIYVIWKLIFSGDAYGIANAWLTKLGIITDPVLWLQDSNKIVPVVIVILLWASLSTSFLAFIAGFQTIDVSLYEAAAVDGIRTRWQELWYITLPSIKPQMMFSAIMSITSSFAIGDQITMLVGFPSPNYAAHTIMHHLQDYGSTRFEMGYACAIATVLFLLMVICNTIIQKFLKKVGE